MVWFHTNHQHPGVIEVVGVEQETLILSLEQQYMLSIRGYLGLEVEELSEETDMWIMEEGIENLWYTPFPGRLQEQKFEGKRMEHGSVGTWLKETSYRTGQRICVSRV